MTLIYNYIYREVLLLAITIIGVLTFMLVGHWPSFRWWKKSSTPIFPSG